uniref:Major facilitator superfamily (MFS) profile domain-containing protein n=1 Tax=Periophthalmus magnuspinnatus TaxID=409849 RepID=A0A3B4AWE9_9GOBI
RERRRAAAGPAGAPDGGYAWFILLSGFTVFGLTFGVIKSFGVFYVEIHHYFDTSATTASWITSIAVAAVHVAAPLASALSARFGHRSIVMIGGLVCSAGVISGSFARNLLELYLTVGFLNGLGYALVWTPTVTMVGLYFDRKRPVANALSSAGECILTFIFTPLSQWLIDSYSWRGAMLILGGLQLNLCVCGAMLRPLKSRQDYSYPKDVKANEEGEKMLQSQSQSLHKVEKKTLKSKIVPYVDFTLIANAEFMVYSMFGVFAALGLFAPPLFLVPYARSRGVHQLIATVILLGVVLLVCPLASSFAELAVFSAAFGLVFGAMVAVHITVLAEVVGVHRLGSALGFFMLIRSGGGLLGPPIAGFFIDYMGDYGAGFLMAGTSLLISVLFLILLEVLTRKGQGSGGNALCKVKAKTDKQSHKVEEEEEAEIA